MTMPPLPKIRLDAVDYPGEQLEVEVLGSNEKTIKAVVPLTTVTFFMNRPDNGSMFRGFLGGREYTFDPGTIPKRGSVRAKRVA
jgi:hypothetical protein